MILYLFILTWILQSEVRLRLQVFVVDDVLPNMLGEDLVQHVVDRQAEALLVLQQLLHQEGVKVVGVHHVVPATHHHQIRLRTHMICIHLGLLDCLSMRCLI